MHRKTSQLASRIRNEKLLKDKIDILKNAYQNEECYILTAGPSLAMVDIDKLREATRGKLVIAVKQAYNIIPDLVDFHVINPINYIYYQKNSCIRVYIDGQESKLKAPKYNPDVSFEIDKNFGGKRDLSLANTMDYERYLINKSLLRPWGPGIMHEIVIYLPILFGCSSINIIGWDLGEKGSSMINRFYENESILKIVDQFFYKILPLKVYNKYIAGQNRLRSILHYFNNRIIINKPGLTPNEADFVALSTEMLYTWITNKNIKVNIISEQSMVSEKFPRKSINEILTFKQNQKN